MNQEKAVYDLLLLSGIKKTKARKLSKVITAIYSSYPRPEGKDIQKQLEAIAERATRFAGERMGDVPTATVRQRISDKLSQFYLGIATNGAYDAIKLLIAYLSAMFCADDSDEEIKKLMIANATAYREAYNSLPEQAAKELEREMFVVKKFWEDYKQKLMSELRNDELLSRNLEEYNLLSITYEFEGAIREE